MVAWITPVWITPAWITPTISLSAPTSGTGSDGSAMVAWITTTMNSLGYLGIGLLMFLENLFPPIPSELIMPLAGFTAAQGKMNVWLAILAGTIGTMLGALPWYYAGTLFGEHRLRRWADRYGKWAGLSAKDIDKSNAWFNRHGVKAVFLGRLVPGIRTIISLPAGLSALPLSVFLLYSTIGTALWTGFLTALGFFLGKNYAIVDDYLGPVSKFVLLGLIVAFGIWVWRQRKSNRTNRNGVR